MPFGDVHHSSAETGGTNEWATPAPFFERLHAEFDFTLDVAAQPDNAKCARYFTPETDGLQQDWLNERCWVNPPYGRVVGDWVAKAAEKHADLAVVLIFSRTDTQWWERYAMQANEIRFVTGRLKFGGCKNSAPTPSALLIYKASEPQNPSGPRICTYPAHVLKQAKDVNGAKATQPKLF